jgi:hypothetical protein
MRVLVAALLLILTIPAAADPAVTLVIWAPGYPGNTEQAQPSMDAFAAAVAAAAERPADGVRATYYETVEAGMARLSATDPLLAVVPLPVYLTYGERLGFVARLQVVPASGEEETWSLVARKDAIRGPESLSGWELASMAGYSPRFVRTALSGWGSLPETVEVQSTGRVLSKLRSAAAGEPVAVLLDDAQADALPALPFAADLEIVARSTPLLSSVVCTVGETVDPADADALLLALTRLDEAPGAVELLETIRVRRFETLEVEALAEAERVFRHEPE